MAEFPFPRAPTRMMPAPSDPTRMPKGGRHGGPEAPGGRYTQGPKSEPRRGRDPGHGGQPAPKGR